MEGFTSGRISTERACSGATYRMCGTVIDASVRYADIGSAVSVSGGGEVTFGKSRLSPYLHAALDYKILYNEHRILLVCREKCKQAIDFRVGQHEHILTEDPSDFEDEIAGVAGWPNAAIAIDISREIGAPGIRIFTNHNPNTCVYVWASYAEFRVSWDYNAVARSSCQNRINLHQLSRWLMMHGYAYDSQTIFANIFRVTVDSEVFASPHRLRITQRDRRREYAPREMARDVPFQNILEEYINAAISRRKLGADRVVCEVSGGLDSAVLLLLASRLIPSLSAAGIAVSASFGQPVNQTIRQRKITASLNVPLLLVDIAQHLPFSPDSPRREPFCTSYMAEPFHEAFFSLTEKLRLGGYDTLISGVGGNEAFPLFPSDDGFTNSYPGITRSNPSCVFITREAFLLAQSAQVTSNYTLPYVAPALQAVEARHQRLLLQGMWSINPFLEPEIIQFGSSLPPHLRKDRLLLKKVLSAVGLRDFLVDIHDSFESSILDTLVRSNQLMRQLCQDSVCADVGLIEPSRLWTCYEDVCRRGCIVPGLRQAAFHIIMFMHMELFLGHYRRGGYI